MTARDRFIYICFLMPLVKSFIFLQLRLVRSTVHLTGNPSTETKQRLIDLLAPSRYEVVATTAAAPCTCSSSRTTAPLSSDISSLEATNRRAVNLKDYPGALRDEDDHNGEKQKEEHDLERSGFGVAISPVGGSPIPVTELSRKSSRGSGTSDVERVEVSRVLFSLGGSR